jgi:hypothetical protein
MLSDVSRELASDLAVRALGLAGDASQRVFADSTTEEVLAGSDDSAVGGLALAENLANVRSLVSLALGNVGGAGGDAPAVDEAGRAAVWNAIAMSIGPGDPWVAKDWPALEDDALVRFYQLKAFARLASPDSLAALKAAETTEPEPLLAELARDALASGGVGLARTKQNASAVTNGTTTKP